MTTRNVFDAGPALVQVWTYNYPDGPAAFSGMLGKGQSQTFTSNAIGLETTHLTVSIDGTGLITVVSSDYAYYNSGFGATVVVRPAVGFSAATLTGVTRSQDPLVVSSQVNFGFVRDRSIFGNSDPAPTYDMPMPFTDGGVRMQYSAYGGGHQGSLPFTLGTFTMQLDYPPPVVVAADESVTVMAGSIGNAIPTSVTANDTPVTPDAITVTQPTHGTASVNGVAVTYTPNAEFIGEDSFTYTATYSGVQSNAATVSVTVKTPCDGPLLEVWPVPDQAYPLRIRAYAADRPFGYTVAPATSPDDTVLTQCDSRLVFLFALAKAKAHYGHPDANVYADQFNVMLNRLRAGAHGTKRYVPHDEPRDELRHREDPDPSAHWIHP